jgi:phosphoserine phosphatase RsbU/P
VRSEETFRLLPVASVWIWLGIGRCVRKGPAAALLASLIQGMFAVETSRWQGPARALSLINEALIRRGIEPRFATLSCATVTKDGSLTYADAGHNPPLLVTDQGIRRLVTGGPMLGVFGDATFPEETVRLRGDDLLIVFSDGVTDALKDETEEFGEHRLVACVEASCALSPARLVASALNAVRQFSRGQCTATTPRLSRYDMLQAPSNRVLNSPGISSTRAQHRNE